jgi:hypothetical protein
MEEYSKSLSFWEKTLEIREKILPSNHPDLAQCYRQIDLMRMKMGEYSKGPIEMTPISASRTVVNGIEMTPVSASRAVLNNIDMTSLLASVLARNGIDATSILASLVDRKHLEGEDESEGESESDGEPVAKVESEVEGEGEGKGENESVIVTTDDVMEAIEKEREINETEETTLSNK